MVNAGIGVIGDALELNADDIDRLFKNKNQAPYHAAVEAARQMPAGGRILIIGSGKGERMPVAGMAADAASKSALQGRARGLARDFGPRGITINVVQPGPIDTDANPANGPMRDMLHSFMAIKRPEGGRILIIGSVNGDRMPVAGMAAYAASKSALQGMARGLARDFGPRVITINVVQPGPIDTDATPANGPMRDMLHSFMAIKRHGQPDEVAGMVAGLAGPEAIFVTGAMQTIDGAFGAYPTTLN